MRLKLSPDVLALNPGLGAAVQVDDKHERVPRAPRQEATGLWTLLEAGWSVQSPDAIRYRLYKIGEPAMDTGLCASERAACDKAKEMSK